MLEARIHKITAEEQRSYRETFVARNEVSNNKPGTFRFHSDQVKEMLDDENVHEFRIEMGQTEEGAPTPILIAADEEGRQVGDALEGSFPCPPICG